MISTPTKPSRPKTRFGRFLGISAALLLAGASVSQVHAASLNPGDQAIEAELQKQGLTLKGNAAVPSDKMLQAVLAAINNLPSGSSLKPSQVVSSGIKRVPQFGVSIIQTGLSKLYTGSFAKLGTEALKRADNDKIVRDIIKSALTTYKEGSLPNGNTYTGNTAVKSDIAAAITFAGVTVTRALPNPDTSILSPLQATVKAAVAQGYATAKSQGQTGGAPGALSGAVQNIAASVPDNSSLASTAPAYVVANNLIKAILGTAGRAAPKRVLDLGEAAGYAYARAYVNTHTNPATLLSATAFIGGLGTGNADLIKANLIAQLTTKKTRPNAATLVQLSQRIANGISSAFAGVVNSGSGGVAFNNGVASPVTTASN